jgi:hypothetical protein
LKQPEISKEELKQRQKHFYDLQKKLTNWSESKPDHATVLVYEFQTK